MKSKINLNIKLVFITPIAVTLIVTPLVSYDPINIPKFIILQVFSTILIVLMIFNRYYFEKKQYRKILLLLIFFICWSIIVSINLNKHSFDNLYGITGRQTGLLTYIAFIILTIYAIFSGGAALNKAVINAIIISGAINGIYGFIQSVGVDPFNWVNPYSPVFGFFGNPNFHSAFMGLCGTAAYSILISKNSHLKIKLALFLLLILVFYNIYKSNSQQGYFVIFIGISTVIYLWMIKKNYFKLKYMYLLFLTAGGIAVLLDFLQKAPWSSLLYEQSTSFRGDFWRAGWQMTLSNPIFGVSFDGYRDNYRIFRDKYAVARDSNTSVDSAHNIFLDISSSGGFPLLLLYVIILLFVLNSIFKTIRSRAAIDFHYMGIVGCWIAFMAQAMISISHIAIGVWGWILMGTIIGYDKNSDIRFSPLVPNKMRVGIYSIFTGTIFGLVISLPLFLADAKFRSTVRSGNITEITKAVETWPQSVVRMNLAAKIFRNGGFPEQALYISNLTVRQFPDNFEGWEELISNPLIDEAKRVTAVNVIRSLDPLNPKYKS